MNPEQIAALKLLLSIVHPPVIAQLAVNGTRDSWGQINAAAATIEALLQAETAEKIAPALEAGD